MEKKDAKKSILTVALAVLAGVLFFAGVRSFLPREKADPPESTREKKTDENSEYLDLVRFDEIHKRFTDAGFTLSLGLAQSEIPVEETVIFQNKIAYAPYVIYICADPKKLRRVTVYTKSTETPRNMYYKLDFSFLDALGYDSVELLPYAYGGENLNETVFLAKGKVNDEEELFTFSMHIENRWSAPKIYGFEARPGMEDVFAPGIAPFENGDEKSPPQPLIYMPKNETVICSGRTSNPSWRFLLCRAFETELGYTVYAVNSNLPGIEYCPVRIDLPAGDYEDLRFLDIFYDSGYDADALLSAVCRKNGRDTFLLFSTKALLIQQVRPFELSEEKDFDAVSASDRKTLEQRRAESELIDIHVRLSHAAVTLSQPSGMTCIPEGETVIFKNKIAYAPYEIYICRGQGEEPSFTVYKAVREGDEKTYYPIDLSCLSDFGYDSVELLPYAYGTGSVNETVFLAKAIFNGNEELFTFIMNDKQNGTDILLSFFTDRTEDKYYFAYAVERLIGGDTVSPPQPLKAIPDGETVISRASGAMRSAVLCRAPETEIGYTVYVFMNNASDVEYCPVPIALPEEEYEDLRFLNIEASGLNSEIIITAEGSKNGVKGSCWFITDLIYMQQPSPLTLMQWDPEHDAFQE